MLLSDRNVIFCIIMNLSLEKRCVNERLVEDMGPSPLWFKDQLWLLQCFSYVAALFTRFFLKLIC